MGTWISIVEVGNNLAFKNSNGQQFTVGTNEITQGKLVKCTSFAAILDKAIDCLWSNFDFNNGGLGENPPTSEWQKVIKDDTGSNLTSINFPGTYNWGDITATKLKNEIKKEIHTLDGLNGKKIQADYPDRDPEKYPIETPFLLESLTSICYKACRIGVVNYSYYPGYTGQTKKVEYYGIRNYNKKINTLDDFKSKFDYKKFYNISVKSPIGQIISAENIVKYIVDMLNYSVELCEFECVNEIVDEWSEVKYASCGPNTAGWITGMCVANAKSQIEAKGGKARLDGNIFHTDVYASWHIKKITIIENPEQHITFPYKFESTFKL